MERHRALKVGREWVWLGAIEKVDGRGEGGTVERGREYE